MFDQTRFVLREVEKNDYEKGFLELINQLFKIPGFLNLEGKSMDLESFGRILELIKIQGGVIYVVEDLSVKRIIATGKLIVEQKSHGSKMGIIQDVVTDSSYRNSGNGRRIVKKLIDTAKEYKCYKVILNSNGENIEFYEKCGFGRKGVEMCSYLH
jgi:glucosamine-phosphate N-acetyltransferase